MSTVEAFQTVRGVLSRFLQAVTILVDKLRLHHSSTPDNNAVLPAVLSVPGAHEQFVAINVTKIHHILDDMLEQLRRFSKQHPHDKFQRLAERIETTANRALLLGTGAAPLSDDTVAGDPCVLLRVSRAAFGVLDVCEGANEAISSIRAGLPSDLGAVDAANGRLSGLIGEGGQQDRIVDEARKALMGEKERTAGTQG
ncbi:unnamed protein product [Vitrella brassicaformis CCMP3155]|uniref:Uncharacterized protein n=2 Tax=Vitrella brassicaformis TaxID=1169539 RepID=A0A0G4ESV9_VITBC|nr:unnamed protein product [Vitrella brassicaformis CCMP3155]|eukprot:CEM01501.1 unnamed protein product [Vitrella brassicaformis CCMP3155]